MLILAIITLIGISTYFLFNFKTILSLLAGVFFFTALVFLPPLLAGSNEGLQMLIFLAILLIVYMSVGKDIFKSRLLNFTMGAALLLALFVSFSSFCRRGL